MTDYQDLAFWRGRITERPQDGPGKPDCGLEELDREHAKIFDTLIPRDAKVLDGGCGVGRLSERFENYVGFDFVPEFVETAQRLYPAKTFLVADFNGTLPFANQAFDWGIMISAAQYYKSQEMQRVCKQVLVLSFSKPTEYEIL